MAPSLRPSSLGCAALLLAGVAIVAAASVHPSPVAGGGILDVILAKADHELHVGAPTSYPASTAQNSHGHFAWGYSQGWTCGFFPGMLWLLANSTGNATLGEFAAAYTQGIAKEANDTSTHDVGFMVFLSFGLGATIGGRHNAYTPVLLQAAASLAKRYNPVVGMTRSWGSIDDMKSFEVIIDNLLNLELLLWAATQPGGDPKWRDMAISHASKTAEYWIRPDNSTYHLVVFNPETAAVISRSGTPQGYSVNSTWARGQAWGIYGFTMMYRYTRQSSFLAAAARLVEYYVRRVPSDLVPLWDFDAPADQQYKDTSCASITASAPPVSWV